MAAIIALALGLASAVAPQAKALDRSFNCGLIAPNSWCQYTDNHSWAYVSATWNGTAIPMCSKIINYSNQDNGTRNCATAGVVWNNYRPAYIGPNTYAMVANGNSGTNKTIFGWATTSH